MRLRRTASLATVALVTAAVAASAGPATGDEVRTDTTLGGYSVSTNAAPFKVLLDDPANPIPRPADGPIVEADPAYTEADLDSGPTSRGIGAVLWPGGLLGEGLTQVAPGAPPWPLKAEARYPDKPYVATAQDQGAFMKGQALGLDVVGTAKMTPQDVPGTIDLGLVASTSTATVKDGVAIGTSWSKVTDVDLLGGVIHIGSVSTTLKVASDGTKPTSSGSTVVNGLSVGGVGYSVDEKGAHVVGPTDQGTGPLPSGVADPAKALGITLSGVGQDHTQDADGATRDAMGLRITVDTKVLRGVLNQAPSQLTDALYGLFSQMPPQIQGYLFYSLATTPKITFILGAGQGRSAATQPISFSFPPLPTVGLPGFPTGPSVGGATGPVTAPVGQVSTGALGGTTGGTSTEQPSVAGQPGTKPVSAASTSGTPWHGIPPVLWLLVLAVSGTAGWGLLRLQGAAVALGAAGRCADGTTATLPDLRGA